MKKLLIFSLLVLILTVGCLLTQKRAASEQSSTFQPAAATSTGVAKFPAKPAAIATQEKVIAGALKESHSEGAQILSALSEDLRDLHDLKNKTFLSPDEERQRKEMIQNSNLIRQVGALLLSTDAMKEAHYEENENAAVDLLLESLQSGDRQAAAEVIQKIMLDSQVENAQLPQATREILAGIKAELLYHAMALAPQTFAQVPNDLPGPVSQKIWQNVQAQHRQNLVESQAEADEHQQVWSRN